MFIVVDGAAADTTDAEEGRMPLGDLGLRLRRGLGGPDNDNVVICLATSAADVTGLNACWRGACGATRCDLLAVAGHAAPLLALALSSALPVSALASPVPPPVAAGAPPKACGAVLGRSSGTDLLLSLASTTTVVNRAAGDAPPSDEDEATPAPLDALDADAGAAAGDGAAGAAAEARLWPKVYASLRTMGVMEPPSMRMHPHVADAPKPWSVDVENTVMTRAPLLTPTPLAVAWCARTST